MTTAEGAIQFHYTLDAPGPADALDAERFAQMAAWRTILRQLDLIGRDPARYDGFAYGNLSVRDHADPRRFFVTASQTGGDPSLERSHLVRVDRCNAERFEVFATGVAPPSSESITHGVLYAADPSIAWVMHVHSRAIWRDAPRLELADDRRERYVWLVGDGERRRGAVAETRKRPIAFATLGHEDGVFVSGTSADETGALLVRTAGGCARCRS